jgi:hypothetical protein
VTPGVKQTFFASFDVPLDSVDLLLEVSDLGASPKGNSLYRFGHLKEKNNHLRIICGNSRI